jgi:hypothetical protein
MRTHLIGRKEHLFPLQTVWTSRTFIYWPLSFLSHLPPFPSPSSREFFLTVYDFVWYILMEKIHCFILIFQFFPPPPKNLKENDRVKLNFDTWNPCYMACANLHTSLICGVKQYHIWWHKYGYLYLFYSSLINRTFLLGLIFAFFSSMSGQT